MTNPNSTEGAGAWNARPSKRMEDAVRNADHFCPSGLPHLDRIRWKASYIEWRLANSGTEGAPGETGDTSGVDNKGIGE